jgi:hypothetical protein
VVVARHNKEQQRGYALKKEITMKIRKQVYELTDKDLANYPVWEFALDEETVEGQDEATVRPYSADGAIDPSHGMFIVLAEFILADGTIMKGYLTPQVKGFEQVGFIQPIIVTPTGQVSFWFGSMTPSPEQLAIAYRALGKKSGQVFPVKYRSLIPITRGEISGTINAFLRKKSFNDETIIEYK